MRLRNQRGLGRGPQRRDWWVVGVFHASQQLMGRHRASGVGTGTVLRGGEALPSAEAQGHSEGAGAYVDQGPDR